MPIVHDTYIFHQCDRICEMTHFTHSASFEHNYMMFKLEPNMLKILPIIPFSISKKFAHYSYQ